MPDIIDTQNSPTVEIPKPAKAIAQPKPRTQTVKKFVIDEDGNRKDAGTIELPLRDGVKFIRDDGNFKQDGSPLYNEYGEGWTPDTCPTGLPGHDRCQVIGQRNGKLLVQCAACHTIFDSKEDAPQS